MWPLGTSSGLWGRLVASGAFWELCQAAQAGTDLAEVPGLCVERDGQVVQTAHRAVVGWNQLRNAAWHLIDIEPYRERQQRPGADC